MEVNLRVLGPKRHVKEQRLPTTGWTWNEMAWHWVIKLADLIKPQPFLQHLRWSLHISCCMLPMSSEKWGSSQMLGMTWTKTIVDYRDGTQLCAPVDKNWCEGNHLICQLILSKDLFYLVSPFCALVMTNFLVFGFSDSRTEINTIPLTHWKNLGWNWVDSLTVGHPPLEAISAAKSHNSHAENITTRVPNTSPAGWRFSSLHEFNMSDMRLS